tara:strand:+ start:767 stop:1351 length:585 start_codon:yes stop_codon:yes gene_type:complete
LEFFALAPFDDSERIMASKVMCSIAFEHAESAKILISAGNLTSATGLVRLQYEALVRAMWLLYAASDTAVSKLTSDLTQETADRANRLPMLSEMLEKLQGKAPKEPVDMLLEFKQYSWKPLSSFIHGGIHAIHRHSKGYPLPLLEQMVRISNGVSVMVGMLLVILHGGGEQRGKMPRIQKEFADCLPDTKSEIL